MSKEQYEEAIKSTRRFDEIQVTPLRRQIFSTPIFCAKDLREEGEEIRKKAIDLAYKTIEGQTESGLVSEGWNDATITGDKKKQNTMGVTSFFGQNLCNEKEWKFFNDYIAQLSYEVLAETIDPYLLEGLSLANSWVTVYPNGAFVPEHIHSMFEVSGVYYLQADGGDISFKDPYWVGKTMNIWGQGEKIFPHGAVTMDYEANTGGIMLFPSWLPHRTKPNPSDKDRIIYSFNLSTSSAIRRLCQLKFEDNGMNR